MQVCTVPDVQQAPGGLPGWNDEGQLTLLFGQTIVLICGNLHRMPQTNCRLLPKAHFAIMCYNLIVLPLCAALQKCCHVMLQSSGMGGLKRMQHSLKCNTIIKHMQAHQSSLHWQPV